MAGGRVGKTRILHRGAGDGFAGARDDGNGVGRRVRPAGAGDRYPTLPDPPRRPLALHRDHAARPRAAMRPDCGCWITAVPEAVGAVVCPLTSAGHLAIVTSSRRGDKPTDTRPRPMGENAAMPRPPTSPTPRSDSISMVSPPEPGGSVQQLVSHARYGHRVSEGSRTAGAGYEPSRWASE